MSRRTEQVAEMIKEIVSTLIQRDLRDPRLSFVTITRAEVSPDLKHAKLFFSVMGNEESRKDTFKALKGASGYLRRELFRHLQMKYVPELHFEFDGGIEHGDKIQRILHAIEQEEKQNQPSETKES
ncbi:30S ribosome-binding factor RbfA [Candidatus Chlorohelix sp.]|uniref:30S ribosome-binding factor RbfA n=1 Tax=Candidatus Chlorohelix sp. TaxID=3139201 RepID=UPI0030370B4E